MIPIQHRANAAMAAIDTARTPAQKHLAQQEGLAVKADLEKQIADENFKTAFTAAKPKSVVGMWKGEPVRDAPVFMTGPAETRITGPVKLPDGSLAAPNPQGQIVVPASMVPAMMGRGYCRANSVITELGGTFPDPARPNNT